MPSPRDCIPDEHAADVKAVLNKARLSMLAPFAVSKSSQLRQTAGNMST